MRLARAACPTTQRAKASGRLKTELFYSRDWQTVSTDQFIEVVDSYIRWYNEKRIKISLGALSPIEYRESLGLDDINQSKNSAAPPDTTLGYGCYNGKM